MVGIRKITLKQNYNMYTKTNIHTYSQIKKHDNTYKIVSLLYLRSWENLHGALT